MIRCCWCGQLVLPEQERAHVLPHLAEIARLRDRITSGEPASEFEELIG